MAKLFSRSAELRVTQRAGIGQNEVTISWPSGLPDFELEAADGLLATNLTWMPVPSTPTVIGDDNTVTFSNTTGERFFRLRRIR